MEGQSDVEFVETSEVTQVSPALDVNKVIPTAPRAMKQTEAGEVRIYISIMSFDDFSTDQCISIYYNAGYPPRGEVTSLCTSV